MGTPRILALSALIAVAGSLGACQQSTPPQQQESSAEAVAPEAKPGISLAAAELVLPVLAGRPGAVYFQVTNGSDAPVSLVSAYVEGASSAEIHAIANGKMEKREAIAIEPGQTIEFARGGLHVMAFDLSDSLAAGGTSELTLTFADGDKVSAPLTIIAGGGGAMQGMDH